MKKVSFMIAFFVAAIVFNWSYDSKEFRGNCDKDNGAFMKGLLFSAVSLGVVYAGSKELLQYVKELAKRDGP